MHMELGVERERGRKQQFGSWVQMWLNSTFLSYTRSSFIMAVSFFFLGERIGFAVKQSNVRMTIKLCDVGQVSLPL